MYRIYYADGSVFEGETNPPPFDVQIIMQKNEEGEIILRSGGDFYTLEDGVWIEHDLLGLFSYLRKTGLVLFGNTVSNSKFAELMSRAIKDREELYHG